MNLRSEHPFTSKAHRLLNWGHWFTFFNILLCLVISITYLTNETLPDSASGWLYLSVTWISHISFLCFVCFLLTIFPISLIFPYQRHIRGVASVIATCGIVLLAVDAYSFNRLGYHLSSSSWQEIYELIYQSWDLHPVSSTIWFLGITLMILAYELLISNFTWKRQIILSSKMMHRPIVTTLVSCFFLSHTIHVWADAKEVFDITKQDNVFPMSYPTTAKSLLARYDLLDLKNHKDSRKQQLAIQNQLKYLPQNIPQCSANTRPLSSVHIVMLDTALDSQTEETLKSAQFLAFNKHFLPTDPTDATLNLLYGLPSLYKHDLLTSPKVPLWLSMLQGLSVNVEFNYTATKENQLEHFERVIQMLKQNNNVDVDLHITFHFQPSLSDELLQQITQEDKTHVILLQRTGDEIGPLTKSTMYAKWPKHQRYRYQVTDNMGVVGMLMHEWFACPSLTEATMTASNMFDRSVGRVLINSTQDTIISIQRDKITLLNTGANVIHFSATTGQQIHSHVNMNRLTRTIDALTQFSRHDNALTAITTDKK